MLKGLVRTAAVLTFIAGVAVRMQIANASSTPGPSKDTPAEVPELPAIPYTDGPGSGYPVNSHGQSYGSSADASTYGGEPDLVLVIATNGKTGYAKRTDLRRPQPRNPEEAVAMTKANAGATRTVPVYDQEGNMVIGEFVIGAGNITG